MTDNLTPTFTDRFSDPKTMGMIALGLFGVGILLGWKLAGGAPVRLKENAMQFVDAQVINETIDPATGFPFIPPYNVDDAGAAAFKTTEE
jgi:hypothetical protein